MAPFVRQQSSKMSSIKVTSTSPRSCLTTALLTVIIIQGTVVAWQSGQNMKLRDGIMSPEEESVANALESLAAPQGGVVVVEAGTVVEVRLGVIPEDRHPQEHPLSEIGVFEQLVVLDLAGYPTRSSDLKWLSRFKELKSLDLSDTAFVGDGAMKHIARCSNLEALSLAGMRVTGRRLGLLSVLGKLRTVRMDHSAVDSKGIRALASLSQIEIVGLQGHELKDKDLDYIVDNMPQLKEVDLWGQDGISEGGLSRLQQLTRVEVMNLAQTNADDSVVEAISRMKSLRSVDLTGRDVSQEGVKRLREKVPNITVRWDARR